jgi:hypothetical protein
MTFTPHISIYPEGKFDYEWLGDNVTRATLIFSKNLDYNKTLPSPQSLLRFALRVAGTLCLAVDFAFG